MSYEKKYKESFERAKSYLTPDTPDRVDTVSVITTIFPELKESEDEKIRKEIIDYIKTGTYHKSWIAWLEKQGEQKYTQKDVDNAYLKGVNTAKRMFEKQGEQEKDILEDAILDGNEDGLIAETIRYKHEKHGEKKPADSYCQENCKGFQETGKCFADGECKAKKEAKQKPAWSEDDERICYCLIRNQENSVDTVDNPMLKGIYRERIDWLKSLKGRVQPQNTWKPNDKQKEE